MHEHSGPEQFGRHPGTVTEEQLYLWIYDVMNNTGYSLHEIGKPMAVYYSNSGSKTSGWWLAIKYIIHHVNYKLTAFKANNVKPHLLY